MNFTSRSLTLSLLTIAIQQAYAAPPAAHAELDTVVVTATRSATPLGELSPAVSSTGQPALSDKQIRDFRDLGREEPGLNVARHPRFGLGSINIRGLDGNRVLLLQDGIRLPEAFSSGPLQNTGRDMVDFAQLRAVEVVRGPASSLYGSDALGGVVGMRTLEPTDLLRGSDKPVVGKLSADYDDADHSKGLTATLAGNTNDRTLWLLQGGYREGRELENQGERNVSGSSRTTPLPQQMTQHSTMFKLQHRLDGGHKLGLTLEQRRREVDTEALNDLSSSVRSSRGEDAQKRQRVALDYQFAGGGVVDSVDAKLYWQQLDSDQNTYRVTTATPLWSRQSNYQQTQHGLSLQAGKRIAGDIGQHWLFGGEWLSTDYTQWRAGFPAAPSVNMRDMPNSTTRQWGLFAQNTLEFAAGKVKLTPGGRYDRYDMRPEVDAKFLAGGGGKVSSLRDGKFSPKLALNWKLADSATLFGQYSAGFRAPTTQDVNGSFTNLAHGYAFVANPDLKPESSRGVELGARLGDGRLGGSITVFDNRYRDFIEQASYVCPGAAQCVAGVRNTFQMVNLSRVRIYGSDARAHWQFAPGWRTTATLAWAQGRDEDSNAALDSVAPLKGVVGVAYDSDSWGSELQLNTARRHGKLASGSNFKAPGYGVFDLTMWWQAGKQLRVSGGVFNLADRKYWQHTDVRGMAANDSTLDRYTQPGRSLRLKLDWQF